MKKILALLLALLTLLSFTTLCVGAESTADETDTNRYYFYKPDFWNDSEYSDTVGIYWWDSTDAPEAWPGYEAKKADAEGVYYYDVPKDVTTIIWNNFLDGGFDPEADVYKYAYQTRNIGTEYYDPEESFVYPEGTTSFDGMIFVCNPISNVSGAYWEGIHALFGEWYYYYGNGEYGITPEKGEEVYTCSFQMDIATSASFDESLIPIDGDVNYDRKLSVRDATLIQKYIANIDRFDRVEMYLGDYNKDTIVNIKDATAIQKTLAKIY